MTAATDAESARVPTFDLRSLHADLDAERIRRGFSRQRLAVTIGVSASTIARTAVGGVMEADGVLAMVRWLGAPPERFVRPAAAGQPTRLPASPTAMVRADTEAMRRALDRRRAERGISWEAVGDELGWRIVIPNWRGSGGRANDDRDPRRCRATARCSDRRADEGDGGLIRTGGDPLAPCRAVRRSQPPPSAGRVPRRAHGPGV